ncbi:MAG: ABC transporter substrate-binding (seleno)protein SaoB [Desulfopila sp.]
MKRRFLLGVVALLSTVLLWLTVAKQGERTLKIGIPDGAAGLLARYILDENLGRKGVHAVRFSPYTLYDCCGSAAQYAMGSGDLDMAIVCPDAARELVEKDRSFEIVGPVMMNSDILIYRGDGDVSHPQIAVSQKRAFQRKIVRKRFGTAGRPVPMFHGAVPFAFARKVVEGAVVDITRVFALAGNLTSASMDGEDVCTYMLVAKKYIQESVSFHEFITSYGRAVREMDDAANLLELMRTYVSADSTMRDVRKWKKMNVRFTCPSNFHQRE